MVEFSIGSFLSSCHAQDSFTKQSDFFLHIPYGVDIFLSQFVTPKSIEELLITVFVRKRGWIKGEDDNVILILNENKII